MIRIGLTGGIASGKSTVAGMFKALGAEIIDADRLAHQAIEKGTPAYHKIVKTFGKQFLTAGGAMNRRLLGKIVFADPEQRAKLNAIVHPEVFKMEKKEEDRIRKKNSEAVIIYDVPLLFETGFNKKMDRVVLVYARRNSQIKRLMERNGLSRRESLERIRSQVPLSRKKKMADYLIDGEKSREAVQKKVKQVFSEILREYSVSG